MLSLIFNLNTLWWLMLFLYIPACFGLIIIVLLQKGKGQGLAGAFGMGGGMDTIFGPRSSKSLPQKLTYASAAIFMGLALVMSILSGRVGRPPAPEMLADTPDASLEALFDPADERPVPVQLGDEGDATDILLEADPPEFTFEIDDVPVETMDAEETLPDAVEEDAAADAPDMPETPTE